MQRVTGFRRALPAVVAGSVGAFVLVGFFEANPISNGIVQVAQLLSAIALLLGILNILTSHVRRLVQRKPQAVYSGILILAALAAFLLQLAADLLGGRYEALLIAANDVVVYVYQPLTGSVLALLAIFAVRAVWRAAYVRPAETLVVVVVAAFFLVTAGPWAAFVPGLPDVLDWIRIYPVTGVVRGLLVGIGLGATVASVRLLLGFDQPYLDR